MTLVGPCAALVASRADADADAAVLRPSRASVVAAAKTGERASHPIS